MCISIQKIDTIVSTQIDVFRFCLQFSKYICILMEYEIDIWRPVNYTYKDIFAWIYRQSIQ